MLVTVPSARRRVAARAWPAGRHAGRRVALVSKRRRTLPRARRARKSARRTTTILHVQSCTVRARARRARSIISDQRPDARASADALGRNRKPRPQTEPKRRPQGKRTRVYTDSRFQFHTATRTAHRSQVFQVTIDRASYADWRDRRGRPPPRARVPRVRPGHPQPHSALWGVGLSTLYKFSKIRYSDHGPRRLLYVYLGMMPPAFMAAGQACWRFSCGIQSRDAASVRLRRRPPSIRPRPPCP